MQNTEPTLQLRLWTVEEYHRMAEAGILHEDERVELLEGKIIWMSAKGTAHRSAVGRIDRLLQNRLGNQAWVAIQDPIKLNERSEPEPDVAVVKIDPFDYADHHPTPSEVYLIIEVADSSLKADCETKGKAYKAGGNCRLLGARCYWSSTAYLPGTVSAGVSKQSYFGGR